ncbi:MAG: efflux RND transporter periplasmic adaptor subunit [Myxococcaceae bacterium]|nr:efflux RND transporter periplasmic adaptor subunit [Myxococcaceae bacterium]
MSAASEPTIPRVVPLRTSSLPELIERERKRQARRRLVILVVVLGLVGLGVGVFFLTRPKPVPMAARFRTATVVVAPLVREVRATGRVDAVATVSVGAEISGRVATVEVDYNDRVKQGQVLARFDEGALKAQAAQAEAMAAASRAQLAQAKADLAQAERNKARSDGLFSQGAQTQSEHEAALTAVNLALARVGAAEATVAAQQAQASLARTNLTHAVIRAPIDGVVITRNVDPGQTVASMLQTPVLFTVAADLRKMEVVAAVDEADIGEVREGQRVTFGVNAWPDRVYEGAVTEVRNSARVVQDVVTYGVVVSVDNLDLSLKPGMTANVRIRTGQAERAEQLPNGALHFVPPGQTPEKTPGVYVLEGEQVRRVPVTPGLSDGEATAIGDGQLPSGAAVIVDLTPEGRRAYGLTSAP